MFNLLFYCKIHKFLLSIGLGLSYVYIISYVTKNTIYSKTLVYEKAFIPPLKSSGFSALVFIKSPLIGIYDYRKFSNQEVDLKIVKVPNSNNVVIIYDQIQEDIYLDANLTLKQKQELIWFNSYRVRSDKELITCEIKEIDFKIHTNCIACKMDDNGQFKSLEDCDILLLLNYFVA